MAAGEKDVRGRGDASGRRGVAKPPHGGSAGGFGDTPAHEFVAKPPHGGSAEPKRRPAAQNGQPAISGRA